LRSAFGLQREIRRSLKTDSLRLALRRARQYAARFETAFDKVLGVVDQDDYEPSDEDHELLMEELNRASQTELWSSHSSNSVEPAPAYKSTLTEEEWRELEEQQKRGDIAKVLTGHAKRPIPERQQELAEQLYTSGLNLPRLQFQRLLPKLIDRLVLRQLRAPAQAVATPASASAQAEPQPDGPTLYELWELQRETEKRLNKKKSISAHKDEHGHASRLCILSGNKPFGSLTLKDIDQIYLLTSQVKTVRGGIIPAPDSPIYSILAKPGEERLNGATVEKMIVRLGVLHKFAYKKGYTAVDPARTDKPFIPKKASRTTRTIDEADSFSPSDLKAIFSGYIYGGTDTGTIDLVFPYHFWLPLFGLFTGGRLNEICQLDVEDIIQEAATGIWFIRITDDTDDKPLSKSLKNESSHRLLPIHDELIRAGLLSFVEQARAESREKLFSDGLTYNASKGWGGNATTFFTRMPSQSTPQGGYFFNLGIRKRLENGRPDNKKFHSFRHTFIELLRNTRGDALLLLEAFTGHAKTNKTQADDYGLGFYLQTKYEALHSVKFPIDLSRVTYADFKDRLGDKLNASIAAHRQKHGLNQVEQFT
jgi:integrase